MVKIGPEDRHPDKVHVAEGRAEAVQQELVRIWPAARAAPKGAVQLQRLTCKTQWLVKPDMCNNCAAYWSAGATLRAESPAERQEPAGHSLQACKDRALNQCSTPSSQSQAVSSCAKQGQQRDVLMPWSMTESQVDDASPLAIRLSNALALSDKFACPRTPPKPHQHWLDGCVLFASSSQVPSQRAHLP